MEIAFTIPAWLLWTVGILGAVAILFLAVVGLAFMWAMKDFRLF